MHLVKTLAVAGLALGFAASAASAGCFGNHTVSTDTTVKTAEADTKSTQTKQQ